MSTPSVPPATPSTRPVEEEGLEPGDPRGGIRRWLAAAALVVLIVGLLGVKFGVERAQLRTALFREFDATAELKAGQIADWREERLGEARFLATAPGVAADVGALVADPASVPARAAVVGWLKSIKGGTRYETIFLLDRAGRVLVSEPPGVPLADGPLREPIAALLQGGGPQITDLHRGGSADAVHLDVLAPIRPPTAGASAPVPEPIAVVVLRVNPAVHLFPLIQSWPTPSQTAETLLVRIEGTEVVVINELRHRPGMALQQRRPIGETRFTAVGIDPAQRGALENVDYRGEPVVASVHPVAGTGWYVVAKADQHEVYEPVREQAWHTAGLAALLALATLLAVGLATSWRQTRRLRRALAAERRQAAKAERLALLTDQANDIMILFDADYRILEVNARATVVYGYSRPELLRLTAADLRPPEKRSTLLRDAAAAIAGGAVVYETVHQRRDGSIFPVEVHGRMIQLDGRRHYLAVIRDLVERHTAEAALRESEERFRLLFANSLDPVLVTDPVNGKIESANPAACVLFGRTEEELRACEREDFVDLQDPRLAGILATRAETGSVTGELRVRRKNGSLVEVALTSAVFTDRNGRIRSSMMLRDLTETRRAERTERIQRDLAIGLSQAGSLHEGLERCLDAALAAVDLEAGSMSLFDEVAGGFRLMLHRGLSPAFVAATEFLPADSEFVQLARAGRPIFGNYADLPIGAPAGVGREGLGSFAKIPLCHEGHVFGCLQVVSRTNDEIPARARMALETIVVGATQAIARLRAEQALRESEARYRMISENSADVIWLLEPTAGRFTYVSPSVERLRGYTVSEVLTQTMEQVMTPASHREVVGAMPARLAALQEGDESVRTQVHEVDQLRKDGTSVPTEVVTTLLTDDTGRVREILGVSRDITSRRRAETALRESETRFRRVVEGAPEAIFIQTRGLFAYANAAALRLFGVTGNTEFLGRPVLERFAPECAAEVAARIRKLNDLQLPVEMVEEICLRLDGTRFQVEVSAVPFQFQGEAGALVFLRDVTEQRRLTTELRESEQRLRLALAAANQGIYDLDVPTGATTVSPEYAAMLGYDPADFQETNEAWIARLHPDDRERAAAVYRDYVAGLIPEYRVEFRQRMRSGDWKWILSLGRIVERTPDGKPRRMLGTHTDIMQEKASEEALRNSEARLNFVLEQSQTGAWELNLADYSVTRTRVYDRLFGYETPPEQWSYEIFLSHVVPEERGEVDRRFRQAVSEQGDWNCECRIRRRDGELRAIGISGGVQRVTGGPPRSMLGIVQDITERRAAAAALRESEARLRLFVEHAPAALAMFDRDLRYLTASRRWRTDYGLGDQVLEGRSHYEVLPEISETWKSIHRRALLGEVVSADEDSFVRADGTVQWLRWEVRPWLTAAGEVGGLLIFSEDITARKGVESALAAQMQELRRWHAATLGRETRVIELKAEVNRLLVAAGKAPRYRTSETPAPDAGGQA